MRAAYRRSAGRRLKLCRLAFELAKAPDITSLAEMALKGLAEGTQTDSGAVLMVPRDFQGEPRGEDLEIVAARSTSQHKYHRVSNFLASTVMRESRGRNGSQCDGRQRFGQPR